MRFCRCKREARFPRAVPRHASSRLHQSPARCCAFSSHLFDGVLAFGEAIRRIYVEGFGVERAWTFHEAADIAHFQPLERTRRFDLLWIGNWGDEERTQELLEFLIEPGAELRNCKSCRVRSALSRRRRRALAEAGIEYRGYLPNLMAPEVYAQSALSLHVPRRQYANGLERHSHHSRL